MSASSEETMVPNARIWHPNSTRTIHIDGSKCIIKVECFSKSSRHWLIFFNILVFFPTIAACRLPFVYAQRSDEFMVTAVPFAVFVTAIAVALQLLLVVSYLYAVYPRCFVFDLERQQCEFSHIPMFATSFNLNQIEAIYLLSRLNAEVFVALKLNGKRRYFWIQSTSRYQRHGLNPIDDKQSANDYMKELAITLANFLGKPLRMKKNISSWSLSC